MIEASAPKPLALLGKRHGQGLLLFIGLMVAFMQRVNVSVGIVAMTDNSENQKYIALNYTTSQKGMISSVFFYGYMVTNPIAGLLCDKFGAIKLFSIMGGLTCGVLTLLIPFVATHTDGIWAICVLRVLQGIGQAIFYPSTNTHISNWIPPQETGSFSWIFSGGQVGTIVMMALGGELAVSFGGWPLIYYFSGCSSILLGIAGLIIGSNYPKTDKSISKEEQDYILSNLSAKSTSKLKIPWKEMAKSKPFLVLMVAHFTNNWGFFTLLTLMPTYIHGVHGYSIEEDGFLSALPYIGMLVGGLIFAAIVNGVGTRLTSNFTRKFWNSVGFYGPTLALLALSIFDTDVTSAIVLLTIATTTNAGVYPGFMSNHVNLSPNLAGIMMGMTNGFGNVASLIAPIWATFIVTDEASASQWQTVFLVSAAFYGVGNTIYLLFGSADLQPWNNCTADATDPGKYDKGLKPVGLNA